MGNQEREEERKVNPYVWEKLSPGRHLSCIALYRGSPDGKEAHCRILPSGKEGDLQLGQSPVSWALS